EGLGVRPEWPTGLRVDRSAKGELALVNISALENANMRSATDEITGGGGVCDQAAALFPVQPGALDEVEQLMTAEVTVGLAVIFVSRFDVEDAQVNAQVHRVPRGVCRASGVGLRPPGGPRRLRLPCLGLRGPKRVPPSLVTYAKRHRPSRSIAAEAGFHELLAQTVAGVGDLTPGDAAHARGRLQAVLGDAEKQVSIIGVELGHHVGDSLTQLELLDVRLGVRLRAPLAVVLQQHMTEVGDVTLALDLRALERHGLLVL